MDELLLAWRGFSEKKRRTMKVSLAVGIFLVAIMVRRRSQTGKGPRPVQFSEFFRNLLAGKIQQILYLSDGSVIGDDMRCLPIPGMASKLSESVLLYAKEFAFIESPPDRIKQMMTILLPVGIAAGWYLMLKSLINPSDSFSTNRAGKIPKTTFHDVISNSKRELAEVVEYLNDPTRFVKAGARLPRGILLVGESGTGKTLMARAVAGEAKASFLATSGSEFVETFVGKGSARIRALFDQARSIAPCVVFIDEIDALGSRDILSNSASSAHEEYVHTLNQLLTELDGVTGHEHKIVVIGATNRFHAIDSALLRPGRFDRHVWLKLPDNKDRKDILRIHSKRVKLGPDVDLDEISSDTDGFAGADLANLINEAVFFCLRRAHNNELVTQADLLQSLEKCRVLVENRKATPEPAKVMQGLFGRANVFR